MDEAVVKRFEGNPILTKEDIPYKVETVHNAAVVKHDGKYVMLFRSHLQNGRSIIGLATSDDGFSFTSSDKPFLTPSNDGPFAEYEEYGVEDARICAMEGEGDGEGEGYLITYSAYSRHGVRIALARTHDFKTVERVALISQPDMRNAVIFPEKIRGRYARLDRPHSEISPWSICISYSPDLVHWGDSKVVIKPVTYHWDQMKIGPGATPFRGEKGWLSIYHGVFETMAGAVYRLGVALHDFADPAKVLGVSDDWILQPQDPWEITGYVSNVVFSCAAVPEDDGTVKIYWGGADTVMCAGTASIARLEKMCLENSRPAY